MAKAQQTRHTTVSFLFFSFSFPWRWSPEGDDEQFKAGDLKSKQETVPKQQSQVKVAQTFTTTSL